MKPILISLALCLSALTACAGNDQCVGDHCVCTDSCEHTCSDGAAECHIEGSPGGSVDATCSRNAECHVECSAASSCAVECGGSAECHVTCPATGCTVTGCIGDDCQVTCGLGGIARRSGTTATCP